MKKIFIPLFSILICFTSTIRASHVTGGELTYQYLGNDEYRIDLTIYFDCLNGSPAAINADSLYLLGIFDQNNNLVTQLNISYGNPTYVENMSYSCINSMPNLCIMKRSYIDTVTLPNITGGYTLVYERCCRTSATINILNPGSEGITIWAKIPDTNVHGVNNSPVFYNDPVQAMCLNAQFTWNHYAYDPDGDSLVCSLYQPKSYAAAAGNVAPNPVIPPPFLDVTWGASYSTSNMLNTTPPLSINPYTGVLNVKPTALGQFSVGVTIKEYRNGVQIGEIVRDYQYHVVNCGFDSVATSFTYNINGATIDFTDQSSNPTAWFWDFGDGGSSNLQNPQHTYSSNGTYLVTLGIQTSDSCWGSSQDSLSILGIGIENQSINQPKVYPNPCIDVFSIAINPEDINNSEIQIVNSLGKLIKTLKPSQIVTTFSTTALGMKPGHYVLYYLQGSKKSYQKIVVL